MIANQMVLSFNVLNFFLFWSLSTPFDQISICEDHEYLRTNGGDGVFMSQIFSRAIPHVPANLWFDDGETGKNSGPGFKILGCLFEGPVKDASGSGYRSSWVEAITVGGGSDASLKPEIHFTTELPLKIGVTGYIDRIAGEYLELTLSSLITNDNQATANATPEHVAFITESALANFGTPRERHRTHLLPYRRSLEA
ncbi:MAG: hypothetical protein HQL52_14865 [Magnetococcales bacterium]|nr:hypothetical protein [Magnetococcales bacterium]